MHAIALPTDLVHSSIRVHLLDVVGQGCGAAAWKPFSQLGTPPPQTGYSKVIASAVHGYRLNSAVLHMCRMGCPNLSATSTACACALSDLPAECRFVSHMCASAHWTGCRTHVCLSGMHYPHPSLHMSPQVLPGGLGLSTGLSVSTYQ